MNTVEEQNTETVQEESRWVIPRVNIHETADAYFLEADLPGVDKNGLDVSIDGNELIISGKQAPLPAGVEIIHRESSGRAYRRTFVLDPALDTARIEAKIENGVLRLSLPKPEKARPRKITVTE